MIAAGKTGRIERADAEKIKDKLKQLKEKDEKPEKPGSFILIV